MKILILGSEGYLGRALSCWLKEKEHMVYGIDAGFRRKWVKEIGGSSLTGERKRNESGKVDVTDFKSLKIIIDTFKPDVVVHLAEQPSAPFSQIDAEHATLTLNNNIVGTMNVLWAIKETNPDIHLIKLGTAGEYPDWLYPDMEIPEGHRLTVKYQGKDWEIPTPRYFGSWYHSTKFYGSFILDYANRIWGLRATDINQGPVYGHLYNTRWDYDQYFGTVVNRFAAQQAARIPLTVYGKGGQTRGYIHIKNSMQAIELFIKNPPKKGELHVIHQVTEEHSVNDIAQMFLNETGCKIQHLNNPRKEQGENKFVFEKKKLRNLGLKTVPMESEISNLVKFANKYRDRIIKDVILPTTQW